MQVLLIGTGGEVLCAARCARGDRLLDVFDEARAPMVFGCRSATCGICLVEVLSGEEGLMEPDAVERVALEDLDAKPGERLSCRAMVGGGADVVRLRAHARP